MTITAARPLSTEPQDTMHLAPRDDDFVPGEEWFARRREPFGEATLDLGVGPLWLRLEGLATSQVEDLGARFRPFVMTHSRHERADLTLRLTRAGVPMFLSLPGGREEVYRMGRRERQGARDVWSYEFAGTLAASGHVAELALVAAAGPLFDRGLENYLRTLTASFVLHRGGLLLHASSVVRKGRAYVFFGPSGSGKTTVTWLSPHDTILSDDMTLVLPAADGFRVAGIPFGMAHHHVPDTRDSFPVASLLRLEQSPEVRRQPLRGARALAELASCLPFVMHEQGEAALALENAGRLLAAVPAWRLFFRKDDSFWRAVEET